MTKKIEDVGLPTPEWRTDPMPMDGTPIYRRVWTFYRYQPYKANSDQRRRGIKGRWQEMNEYGRWTNSPPPLGNEWAFVDQREAAQKGGAE